MLPDCYEQLDTDDVQDPEWGGVQPSAEDQGDRFRSAGRQHMLACVRNWFDPGMTWEAAPSGRRAANKLTAMGPFKPAGQWTHREREHATQASDPQGIWVAQCVGR